MVKDDTIRANSFSHYNFYSSQLPFKLDVIISFRDKETEAS